MDSGFLVYESIYANKENNMASKSFKEYTIEDLYRLNFSFLIQSIKDKELEDSSLTEDQFIVVQKKALMNIFATLDASGIDTFTQVIEPFLLGRRLETDLSKIQAIVNTIKEAPKKNERVISLDFNDELAKAYSTALAKFKVSNKYESEIRDHRLNIASLQQRITNRQNEIIADSTYIFERKKKISELTLLMANESLNPRKVHELTEFLDALRVNNFTVVGIYISSTSSTGITPTVYATRICNTKVINPDTRQPIWLPIFTVVSFRLSNSDIYVSLNRSVNRYMYYEFASDYAHPHVSSDDTGKFCLGNTATLLANINANGVYNNLYDFVKIYADLLDNYNPDSPYRVLQEVYCNGINMLMQARKYVAVPELHHFGNVSPEGFITDPAIIQASEKLAYLTKNNVTSSLSQDAFSAEILQYMKAFKKSCTPEAVTFIENSDVNWINMPSCYFTSINTSRTYKNMGIALMKQLAGMNYDQALIDDTQDND